MLTDHVRFAAYQALVPSPSAVKKHHSPAFEVADSVPT